MDDETLLSQPIKELIGRLASCLKEEAQTTITESRNRYDQQVNTLISRVGELERILAKSETDLKNKDCELTNARVEMSDRQASENALKTQVIEAKQVEARLNSVLEEKHCHNREAMEYYRQSVKEQRGQDQLAKIKAQCIELENLKENIEKLRSWKEVEQVNRTKLEAEVVVKTDIIDLLMSEKNRNTGDPADKESLLSSHQR